MFEAMSGVIDSMQRAITQLRQAEFNLALDKLHSRFNSLPNLEVSPTLDFSNLIEQVGKNSKEAGTILQSNGSPVAVIFSTEQYKAVDGIIKFIPSVIRAMQDTLKARIEFKEKMQEISVEIFNVAGPLLNIIPAFITIGTIATLAGAFFLGKKYHEVENDPTKSKSRTSYILPSVILTIGLGSLGLSAYLTNLASQACFKLVKDLSSIPE